jgi:hypothetical protein
MSMKAQILSTALFTAFTGVLAAAPADPQLLNLLPPDAKVLAGVNVERARGTTFGQYVLDQIQTHDAEMQKLIALTGFDPRRDVREVLVASDGAPKGHTGLALARGNFDVGKITTAALASGEKIATESYGGVTILEDPKGTAGIAFLDNTTVIAGDLASVKAALDRRSSAQPLSANLLVKIDQWSNSQDAWGISVVPPTSLAPVQAPAGAQPNPMMGAAQNVQQVFGGVKFGANVVFSAEAVCDSTPNAATLGDLVKFMINLAQMQASKDPQAQQLVNSVKVTPSGSTLNVSASLPEDVFIKMVSPARKAAAGTHRK